MRSFGFLSLILLPCAFAVAAPRVDFGYAFGPPHRITIARPIASEKTLLDLEPGRLTMSWSYDDLRHTPLAIWKTPRTEWTIRIHPSFDGKPIEQSSWTRIDGFLPSVDNLYRAGASAVRLEAIGGATGALLRATAQNDDAQPHRFAVACEVIGGWVEHNPAWIDPARDARSLLAMQYARADRVLLFGVGGDAAPVRKKTLTIEWTVPPHSQRAVWFVRPYEAYEAELPALEGKDWAAEFAAAKAEWNARLAPAIHLEIPDEAVRKAFRASLADLFIMREPFPNGYIGAIAGSEMYRSTNPFEGDIVAVALDQMGMHTDAADGLRLHLEMQEPDGNWDDPKGWTHQMWGTAGMKAWAGMEHYHLTGDRAFLERLYPRLLANSRWQESQRMRTRIEEGGQRPITFGLMPRGMGDGGLMNGLDNFGFFYPHNILATFADGLAVEAAGALGRTADLAELQRDYGTARHDLLVSLDRGALEEDGYRWIPGSPRNPSGSRWGVLYAAFPTGILPPDHPLITGTLHKIEKTLSPGGQPVHTGWMPDGTWPAVTLDNLAEVHLVRGEGDTAIGYLYSTLNHGTPLYTWCEERGLEPGAKKISGDRQHLWTPVAIVRFLRDALVMEQGTELHLALATDRSWLDQGQTVGITGAPTNFGAVTYRMESDVSHGIIRAQFSAAFRTPPSAILLHVRRPRHAKIRAVTVNGIATSNFDAAAEIIRLPTSGEPLQVEIHY